MQNLSGMSSVWDTLMADGNQQQLTDQQDQARKKKILAAGQSPAFQNASQFIYGSRTSPSMTPMG
jgi:hypothetical protein